MSFGGRPWLTFLYCLAYDWRLALRSIAGVWDIADEVIVGMDCGGRTWGGDEFDPPEGSEFADEVLGALPDDGVLGPERSAFEVGRKLRLVWGDFYAPGLDARTLQIAERCALSRLARPGGWIVTIDADEELMNPAEFRAWLALNPPGAGLGLRCRMTSVYKLIGDTALVYDTDRHFPFAMAQPGCFIDASERARTWVSTPARVLHWHMGRTEAELRMKLRALCPVGDPAAPGGIRDPEEMVRIWRETTLENFSKPQPRGATCYGDHIQLAAVPLASLRALAAGPAVTP